MTDYIGAWDCKYCGTKGIEGYIYDCPGCSHPRSKDVKFYLPKNPKVATPEQMSLMGNDPNWYCEHCDSGNKDANSDCWNCGAERGSSPNHKTSVYLDDAIPHSDEEIDVVPSYSDQEYPRTTNIRLADSDNDEDDSDESYTTRYVYEQPKNYNYEKKEEFDLVPYLKFAGSVLLVLLIGYLVYQFFFNTHDVPAYVKGFSWSQNVVIEEYKTFHEEGWNIPSGGREIRHETRKSGEQKVHDGYATESYTDTCYRSESVASTCTRSVYHSRTCTRDNGNGSFSSYECGSTSTETYGCTKTEQVAYSCTKTRQKELYHYEDVFGTWYFYDIERWTNIANYPTSGNDHSPYYDTSYQVVGNNFRRIEQPGNYKVYFSCEETGDFERSYNLDSWKSFEINQKHLVTVNFFKTILDVK